MKKLKKKLKLNKTTIAALNDQSLGQIKGGGDGSFTCPPSYSCPSNSCPSPCSCHCICEIVAAPSAGAGGFGILAYTP